MEPVPKALKLLFSTAGFPRRKGPLPRPISTTSVVVRAVRRWGGYSSRNCTGVARKWSIHSRRSQRWAQLSRTQRKNACTPNVRTWLATRLVANARGIDQVRQAHQVVVALHRVPGIREGVFVVVALALFDQEAGLDPPTLAGAQVAALVDVVGVQARAG